MKSSVMSTSEYLFDCLFKQSFCILNLLSDRNRFFASRNPELSSRFYTEDQTKNRLDNKYNIVMEYASRKGNCQIHIQD